jgi:hypothetical protein
LLLSQSNGFRLDRIGHYKVRFGIIDRIVNSDTVFPLLDCRRNELWEGSSRENFAWGRGHEDFRKDVARRFQTLAGDVCMNLMGLGDPGEREARAHQQISE